MEATRGTCKVYGRLTVTDLDLLFECRLFLSESGDLERELLSPVLQLVQLFLQLLHRVLQLRLAVAQ